MLPPMSWRSLSLFFGVVLATAFVPQSAHAETSRTVPEGGGFDALSVSVDAAGEITVNNCAKAPCTGAGSITSYIHSKVTNDPRAVKMEVLDLGGAKRALWVHVPSNKDASAFDLLQAGARVLFQGSTGFTKGQPGSMTGQTLEMTEVGGKRQLVLADISESFVLCGRGRTYLGAKVLDYASLEFVPAAVDVLTPTEQKSSTPIVLSSHSGTTANPLAPLLVSSGTTSSADGRTLVDGDDKTSWTSSGAGSGRGEIALFRAPIEVPIGRLTITITKPVAPAAGAAPKTMYLTTGAKNYTLTFP
jgi:hypothetical protein